MEKKSTLTPLTHILRAAGGSIRRGDVVINVPARASKTVQEADAWLQAQESQVAKLIDPKAGLVEQAYQWSQLSDAMVIAARNAMRDANTAGRLNIISPAQTFAQFKAKLGKAYGGEALWKKIIEFAKQQMREPGCFVAGTLVHTKDGLKPIEQIKVGDLVLSKAEGGTGEQSYQPVTRTFSYENRELYLIGMLELDRETRKPVRYESEYIAVSGSHPIWIEYYSQSKFYTYEEVITPVNAWMTVEEYYLICWHAAENSLELRLTHPEAYVVLANGAFAIMHTPERILKGLTQDEGVQFRDHSETWEEGCLGRRVLFGTGGVQLPKGPYAALGDAEEANYDYTGYDTESPLSVVKRSGGHLPMRSTVYNIEVANTHTYYVGKQGLWVHNKNPATVPVLPAPASQPTQHLGVYLGDKALTRLRAALAQIDGNRGLAVILDGTVGSQLTNPRRVQALYVGSISESGVGPQGPVVGDKVLAYVLGYQNPMAGGFPYTALGDALEWVIANGRKVAPSKTFVDVKASGWGVPTPFMAQYVRESRAGFVNDATIDKAVSEVAKTLAQRSAAVAQSEFNAAYAVADTEALDLYKEFVRYAVTDIRLAEKLKTLSVPGFDVGNWYSNKLRIGVWEEGAVDGVQRTYMGQVMWELSQTVGKRADGSIGVTSAQWIRRNKDEIVEPATGPALNTLNPLIEQVIARGYFPQELLSHGTASSIGPLTPADIEALLPAARQYWLDQGARASLLASATVNISTLPTGLAGQTQGNTITLSADGAGWGWFVDATPRAAEEFTFDAASQNHRATVDSNPTNPAAGKLDLLTVLIHELGHVLGAQDLPRAEDVMSGHLEAGVRRLPTAADAAAWLAAQGSRTGSTGLPAGLAQRLPGLTLGIPTGNTSNTNGQFTLATQPAQLLANAPLGIAVGQVSEEASGAWLLKELPSNAATQTALRQAFTLGTNDRFLTFTLDPIALQANGTGPQDAFEVALLNATTGQSVFAGSGSSGGSGGSGSTGNIGFSSGDALLNLQLGGNNTQAGTPGSPIEHRASSVSRLDHTDGSRTYTVDLRSLAPSATLGTGTTVALSFDLIGFGTQPVNTGSQVRIRDVRLLAAPQAVDDTVTLAEDSSATIAVLSNDTAAHLAGYAPQLVAQAAHGTVVVNADGSFTYIPNANYAGEDSFTYRIAATPDGSAGSGSNNPADASNTATVHLTITPVNDAPVAADATRTLAEDSTLTIDLRQFGQDVEGDALTVEIITAPRHGAFVAQADGHDVQTPNANTLGIHIWVR